MSIGIGNGRVYFGGIDLGEVRDVQITRAPAADAVPPNFEQISGLNVTHVEVDNVEIDPEALSAVTGLSVGGRVDEDGHFHPTDVSLVDGRPTGRSISAADVFDMYQQVLSQALDVPPENVIASPETLAQLQREYNVEFLPPTPQQEQTIGGMRVVTDPRMPNDTVLFSNGAKITGIGTPTGKREYMKCAEPHNEEHERDVRAYMKSWAEYMPDLDSWRLPWGAVISNLAVMHTYSPERLFGEMRSIYKNSGWNMVPDELRRYGDSRFYFGFRQHLDFMIECLTQVPGLDAWVWCPNSLQMNEMLEATSQALKARDFGQYICRRPYPFVQALIPGAYKRSTVRFLTNPRQICGMRPPDLIVVRELTRKDW
jgi:hypothetical protein